jgi:diguanylate cyclase (GGDEF)-like protein
MLRLFDAPVVCGEHELRVTVSIGVALFPDHAIDIEGLRRRSDQALYEAKRLGRNRAVFASTVNI